MRIVLFNRPGRVNSKFQTGTRYKGLKKPSSIYCLNSILEYVLRVLPIKTRMDCEFNVLLKTMRTKIDNLPVNAVVINSSRRPCLASEISTVETTGPARIRRAVFDE